MHAWRVQFPVSFWAVSCWPWTSRLAFLATVTSSSRIISNSYQSGITRSSGPKYFLASAKMKGTKKYKCNMSSCLHDFRWCRHTHTHKKRGTFSNFFIPPKKEEEKKSLRMWVKKNMFFFRLVFCRGRVPSIKIYSRYISKSWKTSTWALTVNRTRQGNPGKQEKTQQTKKHFTKQCHI